MKNGRPGKKKNAGSNINVDVDVKKKGATFLLQCNKNVAPGIGVEIKFGETSISAYPSQVKTAGRGEKGPRRR